MIQTAPDENTEAATPRGAISWKTMLCLSLLVLAARLAYLGWLCPYELAGDEAHYWEWSRRPALSYYSKGPGVAWLITVSTRLLGHSEWAVRAPSAVASFVCAILLARLAAAMRREDQRAGFFAAAAFILAPVFYASSQFMTIDSPTYACWVWAALTAWRIHRGPATLIRFFGLGAVLGLGMLFKYTILLLLPGLVLFFACYTRPLPARRLVLGVLCMLAGLVSVASPIFLWNHQHGWPTVAHLIGHTGFPGGDVQPRNGWYWNPLWTVGYAFYPLIVLGPPAVTLLFMTLRRNWRYRREHPLDWESTAFALWTALPITLFYGLLSLRTDIELNWAVAGLTVLLAPLAGHLSTQLGTRPEVRTAWRWMMGFGITCAILVSFGKPLVEALARIPFGTHRLPSHRLLARVSGGRELAQNVEALSARLKHQTGQEPLIIAKTYGQAGRLAFYMRSHPRVLSASVFFGGRESSYDYFADTCPADPAFLGRPAILVGATPWAWDEALYFKRVVPFGPGDLLCVGYEYRGPTREPRMR